MTQGRTGVMKANPDVMVGQMGCVMETDVDEWSGSPPPVITTRQSNRNETEKKKHVNNLLPVERRGVLTFAIASTANDTRVWQL